MSANWETTRELGAPYPPSGVWTALCHRLDQSVAAVMLDIHVEGPVEQGKFSYQAPFRHQATQRVRTET